MKTGLSLLCAGLLAAGAPTLAQQPQQEHDPVGENLFPPELIMQNQQAIGLEDVQKASMLAEISKAQGRLGEIQGQLQDAMTSLVSLLKPNTVDEPQVLAQLDKVLNSEREMKRTHLGLMVRIKNKLTPEQQARLQELRGKAAGN